VIAALLFAATAASMQAGQAGQAGAPRSALWIDASRLIAEYSGDGLLSKDEFAAFYADWRFESFRSGGDGALAEQRLSPDEFDAALLFLPVSGDAFAVASTAEWNARKGAGLYRLERCSVAALRGGSYPAWTKLAGDAVEAHWTAAGFGATATEAELGAYLRRLAVEKELRSDPEARWARLGELTRGAGLAEPDVGVLERWVAEAALVALDADGDRRIDAWEFTAAHPGPDAFFGDFLAIIKALGATGSIDLDDLAGTPGWKTRVKSLGGAWRAEAATWLGVGGLADIDAKLRADAEEDAKPKGPGRLDDHGFVFGDREAFDDGASMWTLRVVRDHAKAGEDAEPASFEVVRDSGENGTSIHSALVLRYGPMEFGPTDGGLLAWTPTVAFEVDRATLADDEEDRRVIALGASRTFASELGPLLWSEVELSARREMDVAAGIDRDTASLEWTPVFGPSDDFWTGAWRGLGADEASKQGLQTIVRPSLALELTDVVESPDGTDEDDDDFLAPRLELGLRYRDTDGEVLASLTSTVTGRLSLDADGDDHILQETVLAFPLDADGIASLNFAFKSGEEGPSFEGVRILTVGLGFKL